MTVKDGATPALEPPRPLPWLWGAALSAVAGLWIAIGEIDHVLSQILDVDRTWSVSHLTGIASFTDADSTRLGWDFFQKAASGQAGAGAPDQRLVTRWLTEYAWFDSGLAVLYAALAVAWAVRSQQDRLGRLVAAALVCFGAVADLRENWMVGHGVDDPGAMVDTSRAKWVFLACGVTLMVICARKGLAGFLRWAPKALYTHRYSVLIVLPLAVLSVGRGPDLLEQIPDIQRRWSDSGNQTDFLCAGVIMVVLAVLVLALGRERSRHLLARVCPYWTGEGHPCGSLAGPAECPVRVAQQRPDLPQPLLRLWFMGPAVLLLAGGGLRLLGAPVSWPRLLFFIALPVVIGVRSWQLRRKSGGISNPDYRVHRPPIPGDRYRATARTGDALVGVLPVIAGLGCIRAFTAPLALEVLNGWGAFYLIAGWVTLVGAYPALALVLWVLRRRDPGHRQVTATRGPARIVDRLGVVLDPVAAMLSLDAEPAPARSRSTGARDWFAAFLDQKVAWITLLAGLVGIAAVGSLPVWLALHAGVIATFQLALGALSAVVAATVILVQRGEGPEAFWKLRIAYAPVTGLLLAVCLAIGLVGKWSDVHAIRTFDGGDTAATTTDRPPLSTLFANWLSAGTDCAQPLGATGLTARPLMLYAAEGGGIRAAYWTAAAVDRIRSGSAESPSASDGVDPCRGAMLSSGASGGSVGLTIASARGAAPARPAVRRIAGRRALGAASVGLVLRDTIFSAAGLPLPSLLDDASGAFDWNDRGTLIEQAWEQRISELKTPFLGTDRMTGWTWGPAGALVVNSTSTTTSCRMLVSQIALPDQGAECGTDAAVSGSADLLSCTGNMRNTTAALLTARFPYVTPSGVITCPEKKDPQRPDTTRPEATLQIVDGGYGDNPGVGTLVDLGPDIIGLVRAHNDCVLLANASGTATDCGGGNALVVPLLVYFDNGTGSDLVSRPGGIDLEVLVPPITLLGAKGSLVSASSELQRASEMLSTMQLWDQGLAAADDLDSAVAAWRGSSVYVVSQATKPGIAAPLGWVLSDESMTEMDKALVDQDAVCQLSVGAATKVVETCPETSTKPQSVGNLNQLLDLLDGR